MNYPVIKGPFEGPVEPIMEDGAPTNNQTLLEVADVLWARALRTMRAGGMALDPRLYADLAAAVLHTFDEGSHSHDALLEWTQVYAMNAQPTPLAMGGGVPLVRLPAAAQAALAEQATQQAVQEAFAGAISAEQAILRAAELAGHLLAITMGPMCGVSTMGPDDRLWAFIAQRAQQAAARSGGDVVNSFQTQLWQAQNALAQMQDPTPLLRQAVVAAASSAAVQAAAAAENELRQVAEQQQQTQQAQKAPEQVQQQKQAALPILEQYEPEALVVTQRARLQGPSPVRAVR